MKPATFLLMTAVLAGPLRAQTESGRPAFALHVGMGGHQGWIGAAGEVYVVRGRLSAWAGAGVLPVFGLTPAVAAAIRSYPLPRAQTHRLFMDVSWTLLEVGEPLAGAKYREYGAGVMIGYSYLARSGLSVTAGGGVAALSADELLPLVQLAVGWTWRR